MKSDSTSSTQQQTLVVQNIANVQNRLRGFIRSLLVKSKDVDDILQEVNIVLWEKSDQFKPGTSFWAWASQIARYKVINHLRSYGRDRYVFDEEFIMQVADVAEEKFAQHDQCYDALDQCLKKLPMTQRRLLDLRYFEKHSIEKVATLTDRPSGSIKVTLYRIRSALRSCIEKQIAQTKVVPS
jgi:RNA polymerase sigma-70 factor (ECF subfamily)